MSSQFPDVHGALVKRCTFSVHTELFSCDYPKTSGRIVALELHVQASFLLSAHLLKQTSFFFFIFFALILLSAISMTG